MVMLKSSESGLFTENYNFENCAYFVRYRVLVTQGDNGKTISMFFMPKFHFPAEICMCLRTVGRALDKKPQS